MALNGTRCGIPQNVQIGNDDAMRLQMANDRSTKT